MKGYYQENPHATAECIKRDPAGFTLGDIGYFDGDGFLHITDRKKGTSSDRGREERFTQNIEGRILAGQSSFFRQSCSETSGRTFCALIVPQKQKGSRLCPGKAAWGFALFESVSGASRRSTPGFANGLKPGWKVWRAYRQ